MADKPRRPAYRLGRGMVRTYADEGGFVYVARLPGGPIHVLQGPAALILDATLRVEAAAIVPEVAELGGAAEADIAEDVQTFIEGLESSGLIEPWGCGQPHR